MLVGLLALDRQYPPPLDAALQDVSTVVRDREGRVLRAFPVAEGRWRLAADLTGSTRTSSKPFWPMRIPVSTAMPVWTRWPWSGPAGTVFWRAGSCPVGSTITKQLARLLEPRERTLAAKAFQMLRAVQLELRYSKQDILEAYLTLAPYGGNLEGVRSASWAYFGREPDDLAIEEIALLLALPQSPEARRPDLRPETARQARGHVLDRLAGCRPGALSGAAEDAEHDPVPGRQASPLMPGTAAADLRQARPDATDIVSRWISLCSACCRTSSPWPRPRHPKRCSLPPCWWRRIPVLSGRWRDRPAVVGRAGGSI